LAAADFIVDSSTACTATTTAGERFIPCSPCDPRAPQLSPGQPLRHRAWTGRERQRGRRPRREGLEHPGGGNRHKTQGQPRDRLARRRQHAGHAEHRGTDDAHVRVPVAPELSTRQAEWFR